MAVYFNDFDPFCVAWLRNQFAGGALARPTEPIRSEDGREVIIDNRDICDIAEPTDAVRQHWFAGIGGWEFALRLAGWPEDQNVWTGSLPCQPWSAAGRHEAHTDARDVWSAFFRQVAVARPAVIIGEQVTGALRHNWLDRVCDDLEGIGYAVGASVLPACGIGAPHIRSRVYWMAFAESTDWRRGRSDVKDETQFGRRRLGSDGAQADRMGDADRSRLEGFGRHGADGDQSGRIDPETDGHAWSASVAVRCRDGRDRRIPLESGFRPLVDDGRFGNVRANPDLSSRTDTLAAAGNSIVVPLAAQFVRCILDLLI